MGAMDPPGSNVTRVSFRRHVSTIMYERSSAYDSTIGWQSSQGIDDLTVGPEPIVNSAELSAHLAFVSNDQHATALSDVPANARAHEAATTIQSMIRGCQARRRSITSVERCESLQRITSESYPFCPAGHPLQRSSAAGFEPGAMKPCQRCFAEVAHAW